MEESFGFGGGRGSDAWVGEEKVECRSCTGRGRRSSLLIVISGGKSREGTQLSFILPTCEGFTVSGHDKVRKGASKLSETLTKAHEEQTLR